MVQVSVVEKSQGVEEAGFAFSPEMHHELALVMKPFLSMQDEGLLKEAKESHDHHETNHADIGEQKTATSKEIQALIAGAKAYLTAFAIPGSAMARLDAIAQSATAMQLGEVQALIDSIVSDIKTDAPDMSNGPETPEQKAWAVVDKARAKVKDDMYAQMSPEQQERDDELDRQIKAAKTVEEKERLAEQQRLERQQILDAWKDHGTPAQQAVVPQAEIDIEAQKKAEATLQHDMRLTTAAKSDAEPDLMAMLDQAKIASTNKATTVLNDAPKIQTSEDQGLSGDLGEKKNTNKLADNNAPKVIVSNDDQGLGGDLGTTSSMPKLADNNAPKIIMNNSNDMELGNLPSMPKLPQAGASKSAAGLGA